MAKEMNSIIKQVCSDALMDMLLHVALKQVMHTKWTLALGFLGCFCAQKTVTCDAFGKESLDVVPHEARYVDKWKQQGLWPECHKPIVFDPGGFQLLIRCSTRAQLAPTKLK